MYDIFCCKVSCVFDNGRGGRRGISWNMERRIPGNGGKGGKGERVSGRRNGGKGFVFTGDGLGIFENGLQGPYALKDRRGFGARVAYASRFASKSKVSNIQLFGYDIDSGNTPSVLLNSMC